MKRSTAVAAAALVVAAVVTPAEADTTPSALSFSAVAGGAATAAQTVTVSVPAQIPKADVLFLFDVTSSMGEQLAAAKASASSIMTSLEELVPDVQFGVASLSDYPGSFTSPGGYAGEYGSAAYGDYPYRLDAPISSDGSATAAAIGGLLIRYGGDLPESYGRALYETYADAAVGWRTGSRRLVVAFGDSLPHDDDVCAGTTCSLPYGGSTGIDPGRDAVIGTADDLDLQSVLAGMTEHGIALYMIHSPGWYNTAFTLGRWDSWARVTGGDARLLTDAAGLPGAVYDAVATAASTVHQLVLAPASEQSWFSISPSAYSEVSAGTSREFGLTVTVPEGTAPGDHVVWLDAVGDGAVYGTTTVTVTVLPALDLQGFSSPVDNRPVLNKANAGQAIPLRWRVLRDGVPVTDLDPAAVTVRATGLTCALGTTPDAVEEYASGSSGLLDLGAGYYQLNWKTPTTYAKSCKTVTVSIGGAVLVADFSFVR